MKSEEEWKITLVGAGNVAWHMGKALSQSGHAISRVLDRTVSAAKELARELKIASWGIPEDGIESSNACLICVSDDAIEPVIRQIKPENCLVMHTAGSVSLDVFGAEIGSFGVLYPLQTFTKGRPLDYSRIPFLTEANTPESLALINKLAGSISNNVTGANSEQRLFIHLAAVFASNFSNHMYSLAAKLADEHNMSFELLTPLIHETTVKAMEMSPVNAQTGPAVRGNMQVMEKHLKLLRDHPGMQELYRLISESIRGLGIC